MILQASYTGVDGSNCIVFTTLHWRTQIFNDKATILVGSITALRPTYTPGRHRRRDYEVISMLHCVCVYVNRSLLKRSHQQHSGQNCEKEISGAEYNTSRRRTNPHNYLLRGIFPWNWMCIVLCLSSSSFLSCSDIKVLPQEELLPDCSICRISWTKARNITFQEKSAGKKSANLSNWQE